MGRKASGTERARGTASSGCWSASRTSCSRRLRACTASPCLRSRTTRSCSTATTMLTRPCATARARASSCCSTGRGSWGWMSWCSGLCHRVLGPHIASTGSACSCYSAQCPRLEPSRNSSLSAVSVQSRSSDSLAMMIFQPCSTFGFESSCSSFYIKKKMQTSHAR